ncbi:hypothetical protein LTR05_001637 [Lithohypha guttulata]|uniref:CENP-V/GFA domain-containing protein n=1 Tax=Lithohypha guttulata TaxID=1690604 RepID=A0AAN7TET0_9EURO|nr:hypothetical protein LTR05_001637 [Lithohypha guttulata]
MAAANALRRGSCLCRKITFTLTGAPARNIQCNCLNCQKSSGSAFLTNILYKHEQYKVDSGSEFVKIYEDRDTDSGSTLERTFCSNCGSNLSIRNVTNPKSKDNIVVCAGSVDDNYKDFVPQSQLFAHRRHAWVPEIQKKKKPEASKI